AIAEELPGFSDFRDHVQVEVGHDNLVFIAAGLGDDLATGVAEVTLAVELADVPGLLRAYAVDGADEISVGNGVRGLLQFPQVFRESGDGSGGIEHDLGAIESEDARAFGKVAVVTDVDSDGGVPGFEDGIAEVAGREIELLPEPGVDMGDVVLAVFAEVGA